jgi:hypothetical protein
MTKKSVVAVTTTTDVTATPSGSTKMVGHLDPIDLLTPGSRSDLVRCPASNELKVFPWTPGLRFRLLH